MRRRVTVVCLSVSRGTFFSLRGRKEEKKGEKEKKGGGGENEEGGREGSLKN